MTRQGAVALSDDQPLDSSTTVDFSDAVTDTTVNATTEKKYYASIYPGKRQHLPKPFVEIIKALEANLDMPVWFIIQNGNGGSSSINARVFQTIFAHRNSFPRDERIALLVESPGGSARDAYKIATMIRRRCGSYVAIVPQYAKSAATLLAIGAEHILMGEDGELGPLDAQILDPEREDRLSALDEVQSVLRLHAAALEAVDQSVLFWIRRSGKKLDTLLPHACTFVANMMKPLFDNIDTVHYTQMSRIVKEAEDYAIRLLAPYYKDDVATTIASKLVEEYPVHGFVIDIEEAEGLGLNIKEPTPSQAQLMDSLMPYLDELTVIGRIEELEVI